MLSFCCLPPHPYTHHTSFLQPRRRKKMPLVQRSNCSLWDSCQQIRNILPLDFIHHSVFSPNSQQIVTRFLHPQTRAVHQPLQGRFVSFSVQLSVTMTCLSSSLFPRPLPDFISQPWRKIGRRPGIKTTSRTGNGGLS